MGYGGGGPPPAIQRLEQRLADEEDYGRSFPHSDKTLHPHFPRSVVNTSTPKVPGTPSSFFTSPLSRHGTGSPAPSPGSVGIPSMVAGSVASDSLVPDPAPGTTGTGASGGDGMVATAAARILASKTAATEPVSRIILPERLSEQLLRMLSRLPSIRRTSADGGHDRGRRFSEFSTTTFLPPPQRGRPRFLPRLLAFVSRTEGIDRMLRLTLYVCRLVGGFGVANGPGLGPSSAAFGPDVSIDLLRLADLISDARTTLRSFGALSALEALTSRPFGRGVPPRDAFRPGVGGARRVGRRAGDVALGGLKPAEENGGKQAMGDGLSTTYDSASGSDHESSSDESYGSEDDEDDAVAPSSTYDVGVRAEPPTRGRPPDNGGRPIRSRRSSSTSASEYESTTTGPSPPVRQHGVRPKPPHHTRHRRRSPTPVPPTPSALRDTMHSPDTFLRILRVWQNISLLFYYPLDLLHFLYKHRVLVANAEWAPKASHVRRGAAADTRDTAASRTFAQRQLTSESASERLGRYAHTAWLAYLLLDVVSVTRSFIEVAKGMDVVRRQSLLVRHKKRWTIEALVGDAIGFGLAGGLSRVASVATTAIGGGLSSIGSLNPLATKTDDGRGASAAAKHRFAASEAVAAHPPVAFGSGLPLGAPVENTEEHRLLMEELDGLYAQLRILGLKAFSLAGDLPLALNGVTKSHPMPLWLVGAAGTVSSLATLALRWEYMMGPPGRGDRK
ncbi:hypothetical protein HDU96_010480 [Phlyctochytrium bullatum]|nr:hypothetical protein HDU96_010480 [Phlyctochytrium bullatum]